MNRKRWALFLAVLIVCSLTGCGASDGQRSSSAAAAAVQSNTVTAASKPTPAPTVKPTPVPFRPEDVRLTDTPDSSCFSRIGYDSAHEALVVVFRDSGSKYCYYGFSSSDWKLFQSADSLGSYYNKNIKGNYSCERVS